MRTRREPRVRVLLGSLLRTYLVGAAFNTRGMQNIGLAYAMEPGLKAIHRDPTALVQARKRYLKHYNSHPFWAPLLVGIFLSMEMRIARREFPPEMLDKVRVTTVYTLSALGDSFFGGSLLVFWALASAGLILSGHDSLALAFGLTFFIGLQLFKAATFVGGLREGFSFLGRLKRWNLINWGTRIKYMNAGLLAVIWLLLSPGLESGSWLLGAILLAGTAWVVTRAAILREIIAMVVLAVYIVFPAVGKILLDQFYHP